MIDGQDSLDTPPAPPSAYYTPLLISIIGVCCTCLALVVYHIVFVKYCKNRPETTTHRVAQPAPQAGLLPTGVDEKLLQTIPIIAYSSQKEGDNHHNSFRLDQSECVVCLGELEDGEMVRLLPNCKHAFHVPCIDEWFLAHTSCPICRSPIIADAPPVLNNNGPFPPPQPVELPSQDHERGRSDNVAGNCDASSSGVKAAQSFALLRHCGSLVLPRERPPSSTRVIKGFKRSLSMDQSLVIIDMQRESGRDGSSSSSSKDDLVASSTTAARSIRHLDRVSTKLFSSFSRLRLGKNTEILPY